MVLKEQRNASQSGSRQLTVRVLLVLSPEFSFQVGPELF